ncbi:MAG: hypothetical protein HY820_17695 [Acidobacteria bacterium]|nr:hypothetical protein [Acidobacteriota bacterium]
MASFEKCFNMKGFDKDQTPRWQMVPVGEDRYLALRGGKDLTVTSNKPAVCTATEIKASELPKGGEPMALQPSDRIFRLHGATKGNARIQAKNGSTIVVELEVDTKDKKTVHFAFNFVEDTGGHKTRRVAASAGGWLKTINYIYNGQANIYANLHATRTVKVPSNLGRVVTWDSSTASEWNTVTGMGDSGADFNIFLVWEYEQDSTPLVDHTDAGTLVGNCIFEDSAGAQIGETMAHEFGHHLGTDDHYDAARKHHLMHGITDVRGIHLPKEDVNIMNP